MALPSCPLLQTIANLACGCVLLALDFVRRDMDLMKILSLRFAPLLQSDLLISVALRLLHRLPEELLYEIARHPFENA
uniref:Uncharacterized protein n=1 Tax=Globisporangium ultimum (strain ATCC 200006 / CBS 805.95 / DAOM BR144) TaxID=431595 RepID=K3WLK0_GLOUD